MKPDNVCQGALDAVLTGGCRPAAQAADKAAQAHLRDCPACRADAAFVQQVRHQGALYPVAGLGVLREKILRHSIPPVTSSVAPASPAAVSGSSKALIGFLAAASLAGAVWVASHLLSPAAVSPNSSAAPTVISGQTGDQAPSAAAVPNLTISVPDAEPNVDHRLPAADDDGLASSQP
jgi:hypothetical protein